MTTNDNDDTMNMELKTIKMADFAAFAANAKANRTGGKSASYGKVDLAQDKEQDIRRIIDTYGVKAGRRALMVLAAQAGGWTISEIYSGLLIMGVTPVSARTYIADNGNIKYTHILDHDGKKVVWTIAANGMVTC